MSDLDLLRAAHTQVEALLRGPDERLQRRAQRVSRWSVAQQLHHALIVDRRVLDLLAELLAGGGERGAKATIPARLVLRARALPRGAERPDWAGPADAPGTEELRALLMESAAGYAALAESELARLEATAPHPHLGPLTAAQWVRFADIHLRHHLKLADEILTAS